MLGIEVLLRDVVGDWALDLQKICLEGLLLVEVVDRDALPLPLCAVHALGQHTVALPIEDPGVKGLLLGEELFLILAARDITGRLAPVLLLLPQVLSKLSLVC